ncbi:MAG: hypothetical protein LIP77_11010, partial [Planctomycetes bacterium]|nr:hypothetical protein [Planctomycetota bacterium]
MNLSTRGKIILLVFSSLGLLAVGTGVFTSWSVREAISEKLRENSANAVALSAAGAADQWKALFQRKVDRAMRLQEENRLRERTIRAIAAGDTDLFAALDQMALAAGSSILAADAGLRVVFRHGDFPAGFNPYTALDIKGRRVGETMLRLARDGLPATALVRHESPASGQKSLFGHHVYLADRDLLIGLWTDI